MDIKVNALDMTQFLGISTELFFHPFRTLTRVYDSIRDIGRRNSFRLALTAFVIGNGSMVLGGILIHSSGMWGSAGFLVFYLFYQLLSSFLYNIVVIAIFYLLIYFFSREEAVLPEIDKLICLYFTPDLLFTALLPLSLLLGAFGDVTAPVYRVLAAVVTLFVVLMKIKALSLIASISKGKSTVLFLMPLLVLFGFIVLGVLYAVMFVTRMFL